MSANLGRKLQRFHGTRVSRWHQAPHTHSFRHCKVITLNIQHLRLHFLPIGRALPSCRFSIPSSFPECLPESPPLPPLRNNTPLPPDLPRTPPHPPRYPQSSHPSPRHSHLPNPRSCLRHQNRAQANLHQRSYKGCGIIMSRAHRRGSS